MPTLPPKISEAEIKKLRYERYAYPDPLIQKRIFAVYLKATLGWTNSSIGKVVGLYFNMVGYLLCVYKQNGFEGLLVNNYGTNKSELEDNADSILSSFKMRPPLTASEAANRIEEVTGIERSTQHARVFMKRHGLKFVKCVYIPAKADNEAQHNWVNTEFKPVIEEARQGMFICFSAMLLILY